MKTVAVKSLSIFAIILVLNICISCGGKKPKKGGGGDGGGEGGGGGPKQGGNPSTHDGRQDRDSRDRDGFEVPAEIPNGPLGGRQIPPQGSQFNPQGVIPDGPNPSAPNGQNPNPSTNPDGSPIDPAATLPAPALNGNALEVPITEPKPIVITPNPSTGAGSARTESSTETLIAPAKNDDDEDTHRDEKKGAVGRAVGTTTKRPQVVVPQSFNPTRSIARSAEDKPARATVLKGFFDPIKGK